jgi:hypothetical protein
MLRTMSDAHAATQPRNSMGIEDVPNHAISLALKKSAFCPTSYDAARILASVLQQ